MAASDAAVYVDGRRVPRARTLADTLEVMSTVAGMVWIDLLRPDADEVQAVAARLGLDATPVHDAARGPDLHGHRRARVEQDQDVLFVVLRAAHRADGSETVEFGEIHVFVGPSFVLTTRNDAVLDLAAVRERLEADPHALGLGPQAVLVGILDEVVDRYAPVVADLENAIDEIEDELYTGHDHVSRRIYELARQVIDLHRAVHPLLAALDALQGNGKRHRVEDLQRGLRDVQDHVLRITDRLDTARALLHNALTLQATLAGQAQSTQMQRLSETSLAQNEVMQRISAWAAIIFAPSLVGTVYGMNFRHMPELSWTGGYPFALALMLGLGLGLYMIFKWRKWL